MNKILPFVIIIIIEQLIRTGLGSPPHLIDVVALYIFNISYYFLSVYMLLYYVTERHFLNWKALGMMVTLLATFIVVSLSLDAFVCYFYYKKFEVKVNLFNSLYALVRGGYLMGYSLLTVAYRRQIHLKNEVALANQQRAESEIAALRSELITHFFFNCLYSMGEQLRQISAEAYQSHKMLTKMIHYSTYEAASRMTIDLSKEVQQMEDYIHLRRYVQKYPFYLHLQIDPEVKRSNFQVPPMLYVNFLENIFKHGYVINPEKAAIIQMYFNGNELTYTSSNLKKIGDFKMEGGLGMVNCKKRLEYLYNGKYQLYIHETSEMYKLILTIHE